MLDFVPLASPTMVLDVACGLGFPAIELAERLGTQSFVHGVDIWKAGLARAQFKALARGVRNVEFHECDAANMPFDDKMFDLIVSNVGLNNFQSRDNVLMECRRVLKSGATLALTTNLYGHMSELYTAFRETLSALGDAAAVEALVDQERSRATVEDLKRLLAACGFVVTRTERRMLKMRFANASALFAHSFTKLAFLDGWKSVVQTADQARVFDALQERLDRLATRSGLELTVPMAYIEAN